MVLARWMYLKRRCPAPPQNARAWVGCVALFLTMGAGMLDSVAALLARDVEKRWLVAFVRRMTLTCPLGQGTLCCWRALSGLCGVIVYSGFENPRRHPGARGMAYAALYFYPYGLFSAFGGATLGAAQTCLRT